MASSVILEDGTVQSSAPQEQPQLSQDSVCGRAAAEAQVTAIPTELVEE